jgi:hypothetical protein
MWMTTFLMLDYVIHHYAKKRGVMALQMMSSLPFAPRSIKTACALPNSMLP